MALLIHRTWPWLAEVNARSLRADAAAAVAHVFDGLQALRDQPEPARHLLVMAKSMNFIDHAGAGLWELERRRRVEMGGGLYFHRPRPEVVATWRKSGFITRLSEDKLYADKRSAIAAIVPRLDGAVCVTCRLRVFDECAGQPMPAPEPPRPS